MIEKIDQSNENIVVLEELQVPKNNEISINYLFSHILWEQNNIVKNNIFAFNVALNVKMRILNNSLLKTVKIEMIDKNEMKPYRQNWFS